MTPPDEPANEADRQSALERFEILDSLPEQAYDDITALMAQVCGAPISLVALLDRDRNWLKSHHGIAIDESPRELSFCGHAINSGEDVFIIEDAREDARFADNPLVTEHGAISYAGVPLIDADGCALGTLCVFDCKPRAFDEAQKAALIGMARQVMYLLARHLRERKLERATSELDKRNTELRVSAEELAARNRELKQFAGVVSHDLKAPTTNIQQFAGLLEQESADRLDENSLEYIQFIKASSTSLLSYIDGLLDYYTSDDLLRRDPETFVLSDLIAEVETLTVTTAGAEIVCPAAGIARPVVGIARPAVGIEIHAHKAALLQTLTNLVANAVKYNDKAAPRVDIGFEEIAGGYRFSIADNGPGIPEEFQHSIFELFEVAGHRDREGLRGTGIGLATVAKLVDRLGGTINVDSTPGRGSTFTVTLPSPLARAVAA